MDAFDDVFGAAFFDPWAEHDVSDAAAAPHSQEPGDALFNPWAEEGDDGPATLHATQSAEADDVDERVGRYCDDCDSMHGGLCPLSDGFDPECI
jgi:hypothetical protein